jgi:dihydroorotase
MDILIRQAIVVDPSSPFHQQKADIFISNGIIISISEKYGGKADEIIEVPDLYASAGWIDIFADFCDPGYEFKETLESGAGAAAAGGYTDVFIMPHTLPVLQNKSLCEYVIQKGKLLPVHLHPIGAVTKNTEGKELTEMYDMEHTGAVAFSDGMHSIQSAGLLLKALQYVKAIDKTIIQVPDDQTINAHGLMNEGVISTGLGLPGKPAIAEEVMIARDIELLKYTGSKLHFTGVSTGKGLDLIRAAKAEGLAVSCSVTPYHLIFTDNDLHQYDTNLKVTPPVRTLNDREALRRGVLDGTVDCIATHHTPQDTDNKVVEFEYAKVGMIGLQTSFAVTKTALPGLTAERAIELFCTNPAKIFGLSQRRIEENAVASLTLFSMDTAWTFEKANNLSRSHNSPFFGTTFTGKPLGIIKKDKLFLNQL